MKLFYKCLALVVVLALAAPFILKDEAGRPLMRWDKIKLPELSAPPLSGIKDSLRDMAQQLPDMDLGKQAETVTAYKWQDAEGIWHYADKLGSNAKAQMIKLETGTNLVHFKQAEQAQSTTPKAAQPGAVKANEDTATILPDNAFNLMNSAKGVNQLAQDRFTRQAQIIESQSR